LVAVHYTDSVDGVVACAHRRCRTTPGRLGRCARDATLAVWQWWLLALVLACGFVSAVSAQQVDLVVDPPILTLGESLTATFSYAGDGADVEPDFAVLTESFDILRTSARDVMQIINGRTSQTRVWVLTLAPREEGTVELPSIDFGNVSSDPRSITVTAPLGSAPGEAEVFIDLAVEPEGDVYVQSQLILTVRLYLDTSVRVSNATLSEPEAAVGDLVVEHIAEERGQEKIGERNYQVFEQRYALFPQRSGPLEIAPVVFSADMRSYFERPAYRRVQSEPISLSVLPARAGAGASWLPARAVTLEQDFPQADADGVIEARVGEPITRAVTLSATGLTAAQLPPVEVVAPADFKLYPDQPTLAQQIVEDGILGRRVERLSMLPTRPGDFVLPPVELTWWDVVADRERTARLEPVALRVLPLAGAGETPLATGPGTGGLAADAGAGPGRPAGASTGVSTQVVTSPGLWPWVALFLGLGWAATGGLLWQRAQGSLAPALPPRHEARSQRLDHAVEGVRKACSANDPSAVRIALLDWARLRWPQRTVNNLITLRELGGAPLAAELDRLDASRYASDEATWEAGSLLAAVEAVSASAPADARPAEAALEPLYRQAGSA
jgi:hypothetical protein